jgi:hypothetical protein
MFLHYHWTKNFLFHCYLCLSLSFLVTNTVVALAYFTYMHAMSLQSARNYGEQHCLSEEKPKPLDGCVQSVVKLILHMDKQCLGKMH